MVPPLLKWPGGKSRELPAILAGLPTDPARLVDPFVGGGALLFATPSTVPAAVNDASIDLIGLYRRVQARDPAFFESASALGTWWDTARDRADAAITALQASLEDVRRKFVTPQDKP